jgi:hypothetical protein
LVFGEVAVGGVEAGVAHAQDDLAGTGAGVGDVGEAELVDAVEFVEEPGAHGRS